MFGVGRGIWEGGPGKRGEWQGALCTAFLEPCHIGESAFENGLSKDRVLEIVAELSISLTQLIGGDRRKEEPAEDTN